MNKVNKEDFKSAYCQSGYDYEAYSQALEVEIQALTNYTAHKPYCKIVVLDYNIEKGIINCTCELDELLTPEGRVL
ncbi:hypothetical protein LCGC14_2406140 [marine sediment metagenome]|uniref:Uncharacterized protein n=1 Tax=marine sediment metagenome TaxID=412755 RepID=A0A0F8Y2S7_9ZZZZ